MPNDLCARDEFPLLRDAPGLVYLDNAATTQKHRTVLDAEQAFYRQKNANVHRSLYPLAGAATEAFEQTRHAARQFLNARHTEEIIFTSGATASINLVAYSYGLEYLRPGDAVLISAMEHHANLIPWQQVCKQKQAHLLVTPILPDGSLDLETFERLLSEHPVRLVAMTHLSNVLGTINPVRTLTSLAHRHGAVVLIDAAQSGASLPINVQELDVDFLVFSAHKMYGPTGTGILYGKKELLEDMPPWQTGGEMVRTVTFEETAFASLPYKFEAGTPNIGGVIGIGAALTFLRNLGQDRILRHQQTLLKMATQELSQIPGVVIIGQADEKAGVLSFIVEDIHPHDLATLLGEQQVCIRAGHHCAQPLMDSLGLPGTARASFAVYNTEEDVARLAAGVRKAMALFG